MRSSTVVLLSALAVFVCCANAEQDARLALRQEMSDLINSGEQTMKMWEEHAASLEVPELSELQEGLEEPTETTDEVGEQYDKIFRHDAEPASKKGDLVMENEIFTPAVQAAPKQEDFVSAILETTTEKPEEDDEPEEDPKILAETEAAAQAKIRNRALDIHKDKEINEGLDLFKNLLHITPKEDKHGEYDAVPVPAPVPVPQTHAEVKEAAKVKLQEGLELAYKLTHEKKSDPSWSGVKVEPDKKGPPPHDVLPGEFTPPAAVPATMPAASAAAVPAVTTATALAEQSVVPVAPNANAITGATTMLETEGAPRTLPPMAHLPSVDDEAASDVEYQKRTQELEAQRKADAAKAAAKAAAQKAAQEEAEKPIMSDKEYKNNLKKSILNNPAFKHARDYGMLKHVGEDDGAEIAEDGTHGVFSLLESAGMQAELKPQYKPLSEFELED